MVKITVGDKTFETIAEACRYYNIKESFPNFLSSSKMSFDNNFVINLKLIQDNLSSFKKNFLSNL